MSHHVSWQRIFIAWGVCITTCAATLAAEDDFTRFKVSRTGAGTPAPAFELTTVDGKSIELSALRGKVIVLNFWATWCGPCKEEMPALDRLSRRFDPTDVAVLTITAEHEYTRIKQFMNQLNSSLPVLLDTQRDVASAFMVRGLPTTVFVAKNGTVVGRAVGPREWDGADAFSFIERLRDAAR